MRIARFMRRAFPGQPVDAKLLKALDEIGELRKNPNDLSEWADVFICLLGAAAIQNIMPAELVRAAHEKMEVNEKRKWKRTEDGTYQHVED
jgi:hypothetical protein